MDDNNPDKPADPRDAFIRAIDDVSKKTVTAQAMLSHALAVADAKYLTDDQLSHDLHQINDSLGQAQRLILEFRIRQARRTGTNRPTR